MTLNIVIFVIRFINIIVTPFTLVVFRNANHGKIPLDNYLLDTDHHYGMVTIREAVVDEKAFGVEIKG